jgi:MerR family redox-sensitive transcriptional activator SoxR
MHEMTIGEVAEYAGLQTSTLRYYESIGLIPPPRRVSGQRRYSPDVLQILAIIQLAKDASFSLDEIKTLFHGFSDNTPLSERWKVLAREKLREIEAVIRHALEMKRLLEEALECESLLLELDESVLGNLRDNDFAEAEASL